MEKKLQQSSADRAWVFCFPDTEYALERAVIFPEKDLSTFLGKAAVYADIKRLSSERTPTHQSYKLAHGLAGLIGGKR